MLGLSDKGKREEICLNCVHFSSNLPENELLELKNILVLHECKKENNIQTVIKYDDFNRIEYYEKKKFEKVLRSTTCSNFKSKYFTEDELSKFPDNEDDD